jgi:hypothetical protein
VGNGKWSCETPGSVYGDDHDDAVSGLYREVDDDCDDIGPDGGCAMGREHTIDYFAKMPCAGATCWYGFEDKMDCEKFYQHDFLGGAGITLTLLALSGSLCAVYLCAHIWECRETCLTSFDEFKKDMSDVHRGPRSSHDSRKPQIPSPLV